MRVKLLSRKEEESAARLDDGDNIQNAVKKGSLEEEEHSSRPPGGERASRRTHTSHFCFFNFILGGHINTFNSINNERNDHLIKRRSL